MSFQNKNPSTTRFNWLSLGWQPLDQLNGTLQRTADGLKFELLELQGASFSVPSHYPRKYMCLQFCKWTPRPQNFILKRTARTNKPLASGPNALQTIQFHDEHLDCSYPFVPNSKILAPWPLVLSWGSNPLMAEFCLKTMKTGRGFNTTWCLLSLTHTLIPSFWLRYTPHTPGFRLAHSLTMRTDRLCENTVAGYYKTKRTIEKNMRQSAWNPCASNVSEKADLLVSVRDFDQTAHVAMKK